MSDLIERVARAMCNSVDTLVGHKDGPNQWKYHTTEARAAIREVAAWLTEEFSYQAEMIEIRNALRQAAGGEGCG